MKTFRIRGDHLILKEEEGCGTFFGKIMFSVLEHTENKSSRADQDYFQGEGCDPR